MTIMHVKKVTNKSIDKIKEGLENPRSQSTLNLMIDSELHRKFKIATTMNGVSMTSVIETAIRDYL